VVGTVVCAQQAGITLAMEDAGVAQPARHPAFAGGRRKTPNGICVEQG
jgi:hypothetical protein